MQRFFTVLILTCLMFTFFVSHAAHANTDESGNVDVAARNEETDKRNTNTAFYIQLNSNILYLLAKAEYDKNAAKIEKGVAVTASKLLATTATVYLSSGMTATVPVSVLVDMFNLAKDIHASASLLSAYEATISNKQVAISSFESAKTTYNTGYDTYIGELATHAGWTKSEVYMYISNDANRRNGIIHKGSSGSGKHGVRGQKEWIPYDNTLPSYTCKGPCSDTFITPTLAKTSHRSKCGIGIDVDLEILVLFPDKSPIAKILLAAQRLQTRSVDKGCGRLYYTCDIGKVARHQVRECNKLVYRYDSHFKNRKETFDCPESYRNCMGHKYDHNNRVVGKTVHSDEGDSSTEETASTPSTTPSTPSYHACGVHETTVTGSHSAAGCGTSGHYACDSSDHSASSCGGVDHFNCDSLRHVEEQCTATNSNSDSCTYKFWRCAHPTVSSYGPSHTHVYPPPTTVSCGRSACTASVSSSTEHYVTCDAGHSYWSCNPGAVAHHATSITCKRSECGATYTKCVRGNGTCTGGRYIWHKK